MEVNDSEIYTLYQKAIDVGLHFTLHGGGTVTMGPPAVVKAHLDLVDALRQYRPKLAQLLAAEQFPPHTYMNVEWGTWHLRLSVPEITAGIRRYKAWSRACLQAERERERQATEEAALLPPVE